MHSDHIDKIITAELTNDQVDHDLSNIAKNANATRSMWLFNPKAPCMVDGKCSKKYPTHFLNETKCGSEGYPKYRRRNKDDGGKEFIIKKRKTYKYR